MMISGVAAAAARVKPLHRTSRRDLFINCLLMNFGYTIEVLIVELNRKTSPCERSPSRLRDVVNHPFVSRGIFQLRPAAWKGCAHRNSVQASVELMTDAGIQNVPVCLSQARRDENSRRDNLSGCPASN